MGDSHRIKITDNLRNYYKWLEQCFPNLSWTTPNPAHFVCLPYLTHLIHVLQSLLMSCCTVYILGHPQTSVIKWKGIMPQTKRLQSLDKTASWLRLKGFRSQEKQRQVSGLLQLGISLNGLRLKGISQKVIGRNRLRWSVTCRAALPRPMWRHTHAVQNKQSGEQRLRMAEGGKPLLIYFTLTVLIKCYTN